MRSATSKERPAPLACRHCEVFSYRTAGATVPAVAWKEPDAGFSRQATPVLAQFLDRASHRDLRVPCRLELTAQNHSKPINTHFPEPLDTAYTIESFQLQSKQPSEFLNRRSGVRTSRAPPFSSAHHFSSD